MTLTIPPGYSLATIVMSRSAGSPTKRYTTTIGVHADATGGNADAMYSVVASDLMPIVCNDYTLIRCELLGADATATSDGTTVGGGDDAGMTPQVSALVKKVTGGRGRDRRGRMYFPGLASEGRVQADGTFVPTTVTAFQSAFNDWQADMEGADLPLVLLHSNSSDPTPIGALVVEATVATQRRRLR